MNATQVQPKEILRQVIRGERPWQDLTDLGIKVRVDNGQRHLENPRGITASGCTGALRASHFEVKAIQTSSWEGWQSTTIIGSASFMLLCFTFP